MSPDLNPVTATFEGSCLLVDDRPENLTALEALLKDEPLKIYKARSGPEALELLLSHEFALALVDVQMPDMSGLELAELMRGTDRTKNIPIIFVTAGANQRDRLFKGYEAGAVDFLFKPLEPLIVRSKVRVFLELYRQNRLLKEREAALKKAVHTRDEFLSIASHELKTPLTSLSLQVQLLTRMAQKQAELPRDKIIKMLSVVTRQSNHLARLIDDLLDVSRIENGKLTIDFTAGVDLSEIVREAAARFEEQLLISKSELALDLAPDLLGKWDRNRIEQVVINLLSNACKYGNGTQITVRTFLAEESAVLEVTDHGLGIPEERIPFIFDRFERAVNDTAISGLGLGLYISKQIILAHQGNIAVESKLGAGSTFTVSIPLRAH